MPPFLVIALVASAVGGRRRTDRTVGSRSAIGKSGNTQPVSADDELIEVGDPPMPEFQVIATPRETGYELDVVGFGATETREINRPAVEQVARDYLSLMLDIPPYGFRVRMEYPSQ